MRTLAARVTKKNANPMRRLEQHPSETRREALLLMARLKVRLDELTHLVRTHELMPLEMEALAENLHWAATHLTGTASAPDRQAMLVEAVQDAAERTRALLREHQPQPSLVAARYVLEELWWFGHHREAGMILSDETALLHFRAAALLCARGRARGESPVSPSKRFKTSIGRNWLAQLALAYCAIGDSKSAQTLDAAYRGFRKKRSLTVTREKLSST